MKSDSKAGAKSGAIRNRVFSVNGILEIGDNDFLRDTLRLAFRQDGHDTQMVKCHSWKIDDQHGLLLSWRPFDKDWNQLPESMTPDQLMGIVQVYLHGDKSKRCEPDRTGLDDSNETVSGWRVYVEPSGIIGEYAGIIACVQPARIAAGA